MPPVILEVCTYDKLRKYCVDGCVRDDAGNVCSDSGGGQYGSPIQPCPKHH